MNEVFIRVRGKLHYLWHAVNRDGTVLFGFISASQ
jgi:transposase-like protein